MGSTLHWYDITGMRNTAGRAIVMAMTLSLGACAQLGLGDIGLGDNGLGSKDKAAETAANDGKPEGPVSELQKATTYWGKEVAKNPKDGTATLNYARNLKAMGRKQDALGVLQAGYLYNAEKTEYVSEYGRLALDLGQISTAAQLLEKADDPTKPDWRVASARGTVLAKQGQYKESIPFYERAREMAPSQSSVLSNLAMAFAMDGQAAKAEELLRQAQQSGSAADPRVKQNLALVLQLQGKKAEAQQLTGEGEAQPAATASAAPATGQAGAAQNVKTAASTTLAAPLTPVTATTVDADEIIRAAMQAEDDKAKAVKAAAAKAAKKKKTVTAAASDASPTLRASAD